MGRSLVYSLLLLSAITAANGQSSLCNANHLETSSSCTSVESSLEGCSKFYPFSSFPNNLTRTATEAAQAYGLYRVFYTDFDCSDYAELFICLSLAPHCESGLPPRRPCASLCDLVVAQCDSDIVLRGGYGFDVHCLLQCERYPHSDGNNNCVTVDDPVVAAIFRSQPTSPSEAQTVPSTSQPIPLLENLQAELIPDNNTVVRQLPAQFYCRITDTTGGISDIRTQWYINGVIYTNPEVMQSDTQTNLTVISSYDMFIRVTCRTSFYPSAILGSFSIDTGFCDAEAIISTSGTTFIWPETTGGSSAIFFCPLSDDFYATRMCDVGGVWLLFDETACGIVLGELNRLNDSFSNLSEGTYGAAVANLSQIVSQTENDTVEQNSEVLNSVADYFTDLSVFVLDSNVTINNTVVDNVVAVVSSLLQWQPANVHVASSSSVIESFEVVVSIYAQQLPLNENQTFTMPSLTLYAELRSVQSLNQTGRSFTIGDNQDPVLAPADQVMPGQLLPQQDAAINLPGTLFGMIGDRTNVGVFFALYNSSVLFPVNGGRDINSNNPVQTEVGSRVLAATVGPGINFQNLQDPVIIVLRLQTDEGRFMRAGSEKCVTWDFGMNDWSTERCSLNATSSDGIVTCTCNHLTNFAVLVDTCLRQEDCAPSQVDDALTFISYIGMSISIVSLVITIISLLLFKKLRQKDASKYHIQLALAILLMLIVAFVLVLLSAENVTPLYGGCVTVSVFVHYFTLVSVMWMGAEALLMFQKLVIVFSRTTTKFVVIVSIICWTAPIPLVAIPLIVDLATGNDIGSDIIIRRANNTQDVTFCFLSHIGAFWGAFLAPMFAMLIFNFVIFIWVIVILVRHTKGTAARKKEAVSNKTIIRLMISITGVMSLFGLTWLFAILTFSITGLRETFQILFVIFNSFQGFFIFLFICIFNKEVLESWKEYLSCGKYKSTLLHPSQAKYSTGTSTGARKGKRTSNAGTTGCGSSSTGGKSVSEVSTSDYSSSTLVKEKEFESQAVANTTPPKAKEKLGSPEPAKVLTEADIEVSQQNGNTGQEDGDNKEVGSKKKKNKTLSLQARIERYSTKKVSKHHVEEIEVDFKSDDSNESSSGEEATDIVR